MTPASDTNLTSVRNWVTFETDDPGASAGAFDGSAPPPGRPLAERIATALRRDGVTVLAGPEPHESYGWEIPAEQDGVYVWCMLQRSDEWLLITEAKVSWLARLRGQGLAVTAAHRAVCQALDRVLRVSIGARDIQWFTRAEFEAGQRRRGADTP